MPTVATQTDITTITTKGFQMWCSKFMDKADDIQPHTKLQPKNILYKNKNKKPSLSHRFW